VTTGYHQKHYEIQTADPGTKKGASGISSARGKALSPWNQTVFSFSAGGWAFGCQSLPAHPFYGHYTPENRVCQVKKRVFPGFFFPVSVSHWLAMTYDDEKKTRLRKKREEEGEKREKEKGRREEDKKARG